MTKYFSWLLALASLKLASLYKVNIIVGSFNAYFSGTSVAMPLVGALGGPLTAGMTALARLAMTGFYGPALLAYHIPGLCAALAWSWYDARFSWMLRAALPALCFVLFVLHPVGSQAFVYAFYWCIPLGLYVAGARSLFARALSSTFIAHAVGSVLWLYTMPTTAVMWMGLIPVVACERLIYALSMVVVYRVVKYGALRVKNLSRVSAITSSQQ